MKQRTVKRVNKLSALASALLLSSSAFAGSPGAWNYDATHGSGQVSFVAVGRPGFLKIHGKGPAPQGTVQITGGKASGALTFELESLATGIGTRDGHMKEKYLEVAKYPQAKLTLTELEIPTALTQGDSNVVEKFPFKGTLTLHGVQKPVEGVARLEHKKDSLSVNTSFDIKTEDFGIPTPSYAGITIANEVTISVELSAPFTAAL